MTGSTPRNTEPHTFAREQLLKDWGYKPTLATVDPNMLSETKLQTRTSDAHETVQQYVAAIRAGAVFPRPIVTSDGVVITGKRTTLAYRFIKRDMPVIILKETNYEGATPAQMDEFYLLDYTTNQENGERMTDEEIRAGLPHALARDLSVKRMSRMFGRSVNWLNAEIARWKADQRFTSLGLDFSTITERQRKALGRVVLNDGPYRQLVNLTSAANLSSQEIANLAAEAKSATSDSAAIMVITRAGSTEYAGRIANQAVTGSKQRVHLPWEVVSNLALSQITKYKGHEYDVFAQQPINDPAFRNSARERVMTAITVLGTMYDMLK